MMSQLVCKIVLSSSRDIPFNKLVLSQSNVRRIKAGVSIEQLAEDIVRRTLLQSLTVRPAVDAEGVETGMFEIPAGGRRYRALELLVKQKRLARTAPIPCIIRTDASPRRIRSPKTSNARLSIPSTSSAPSWHFAKKASARRKSLPPCMGIYLSSSKRSMLRSFYFLQPVDEPRHGV
jgi:hypothetical protein